MFASTHEPHNWGLWLLHALPAYLHFARNRDRFSRVFGYVPHENAWPILEAIGVGREDVIAHEVDRAYRFAEVHVLRRGDDQFAVTQEELADFRALAARFVPEARRPRVFLSRLTRSLQPGAPRRLRNEIEIGEMLARHGFVAVEPEALPGAEEVAIFAQAEAIVGLDGAGLFNTVFCRPGTRVLDLAATAMFADRHADLFASLGLGYGFVFGAPVDPASNDAHPDWRIDVAALERVVVGFFAG